LLENAIKICNFLLGESQPIILIWWNLLLKHLLHCLNTFVIKPRLLSIKIQIKGKPESFYEISTALFWFKIVLPKYTFDLDFFLSQTISSWTHHRRNEILTQKPKMIGKTGYPYLVSEETERFTQHYDY
jgi:hypothetical protein